MTEISPTPAPIHNWAATAHDRIAADIQAQGWSVIPDYLGLTLGAILTARLQNLDARDALSTAGIGRNDKNQIATDIRRDRTFWLERDDPEDRQYLTRMEELRLTLNRKLFMGLFEYEAHYAIYDPGGFYKKHVDALKGSRNRIVSTVCYLNDENWQDIDGGDLILYDPADPDRVLHTVTPKQGSLVAFLSEDIPHEVRPAHRDRRSIAGWFRCNTSSADRPDPLL